MWLIRKKKEMCFWEEKRIVNRNDIRKKKSLVPKIEGPLNDTPKHHPSVGYDAVPPHSYLSQSVHTYGHLGEDADTAWWLGNFGINP